MLTATLVAFIAFLLSLILIPLIILSIPSDYFTHPKRQKYFPERYPPLVQWIFIILKNLTGIVLIIAGIIMLFIPGQGILTIIAGLFFVNFPYKYQIEKWFISRPIVFESLNKLRKKANKVPFKAVK